VYNIKIIFLYNQTSQITDIDINPTKKIYSVTTALEKETSTAKDDVSPSKEDQINLLLKAQWLKE